MAEFLGLNLVRLVVKMIVNHQRDSWTWQVIAYSPAAGWWPADLQIVCSDTEEMPAKDFISFKYQTVVPSKTCPSCIWKSTYKKNPEAAIWHTVHFHQAVLWSLYSGHCLLHVSGLSSSTQAVPNSAVVHSVSRNQTLFCIFCRRQLSKQLQNKCVMVNSRNFPLSLFLFLKPAEINHLVDPSSLSFKDTDIKIISNVSYTPT